MWHPERNKNIKNLDKKIFYKIFKKMIVIILAAGKGNRLYPYTKNQPKCLVTYKKEKYNFTSIKYF